VALLSGGGCAKREAPADAAVRTQTLIIGNAAEPADLDPHTSSVLSDQNILYALFEPLTVLDESTGRSEPAAAESWSASADGLTWTFRLRENLRWSDGSPLTAQDFVDTWRRALTPALAADNAWYLYALAGARDFNEGRATDPATIGVSAPDARTLVLRLHQPVPYLPALVSLPAWMPLNPRVLAAHGALEKRGTAWTRPGNLVGNGPFILREWSPNARIVAAKNPHHWQAATTRLQEIVFLPIEKADDEERAFRAGQMHVTFSLPVAKLGSWRRTDPARLRIDPILQSVFLRFNTTRPPLDHPAVRRALSLALDRDTLARTVLQGSRAPGPALNPPGIGGYTAQARITPNLEEAKRLLASAGFPDGRGFPAFELQARNDELMPRVAEAIQAAWQRDLGVKVSLTQVEQKTWIQNQQTLNYGISTGAWTADYPDAENFLSLFQGKSTYNWTGWADPGYDALLARAAATPDAAARLALLQSAEQHLLGQSPIAPLYHGAQTYLIHPAVRGWDPSLLVFRRYQKVRLEP